MFSTVGFWTLFWVEVLTTFWTSLGGPMDYHLPYPTLFSYLGEHVVVWMALVFMAHLALKQIGASPFSTAFSSLRTALASYALIGLFGELGASLFLYRLQFTSCRGVTIWVDPTNPQQVLQSFLIERLTTWVVLFPVAIFAAYVMKSKEKALKQG